MGQDCLTKRTLRIPKPKQAGARLSGVSLINPGAGHAHVPLPEAFGWLLKGLRPTAGQGPKQRVGGREKGHRG